MSRRFNYFNYMPYTMSYCECDNKCVDARCSHNNAYRFYSCLKQANTGTSNIIGKVFFNVVNRNCFDLKREKVCSTYSFWGSCNKFRNGLAADVKSSMRF
jgi:secretory phospholipase A2